MTQTRTSAGPDMADAANPAAENTGQKPRQEGSFLAFLVRLVLAVLIFRSFIFSPFNIPSESMMPRLWTGDYLLAAKWPYGYSSKSLPFDISLVPGRLFSSAPERGDVVIFKHPVDGTDYIKRVIGLPGDQLQVIGGALLLNGAPVKREKLPDLMQPIDTAMLAQAKAANRASPCAGSIFEEQDDGRGGICRYPQYRETLPNGVSYNTIDLGEVSFKPMGIDPDNTQAVIVPDGAMFVMGDNRDNSLDSRFPAQAGLGVGIVPQEQLVGRATFMMWSTDGSAQWILPWTWFTAARWDRIGATI